MTGSTDSPGGLQIVVENLSDEGARLLADGIESSGDGGALAQADRLSHERTST